LNFFNLNFELQARESDKEINKEIAKLPPKSLVVSTVSNRTGTNCTTAEPTEMESQLKGRRYL